MFTSTQYHGHIHGDNVDNCHEFEWPIVRDLVKCASRSSKYLQFGRACSHGPNLSSPRHFLFCTSNEWGRNLEIWRLQVPNMSETCFHTQHAFSGRSMNKTMRCLPAACLGFPQHLGRVELFASALVAAVPVESFL